MVYGLFTYFFILFYWILPVVCLPYVLGITVHHLQERHWLRAIVWAILFLFFINPILYNFGLIPGNYEEYLDYGFRFQIILLFVMLGQIGFWWYVWNKSRRERKKRGWVTVAIPAFFVSLAIAIVSNALITIVILLILYIATSNEKKRWDKIEFVEPHRPGIVAEKDRDLTEIGYRPYPNAEISETESRIVAGGGDRGRSLKLSFRTSDPPSQVLGFYHKSAGVAGMNVLRGTRIADEPGYPAVPALVALGIDPTALVVARDTLDEFKWNVTIWLKIWPGFRRDLEAYFNFDEPLKDLSRPASEYLKPRKAAIEYSVFQQRLETETSTPAPDQPVGLPVEGLPEAHVYAGDAFDQLPSAPPPPPARPPWTPPKIPKFTIDWGDIFEAFAAVWYIWVGVVMIVVGLGYFLSLQYGALGRVITVYSVFAAMWGFGLHYERYKKFCGFGKALIAGGWSGIYVTTYLIHYLPQARVITDPKLGMLFLMAIAIGMIAHSFKYRSQTLTTFTYLIAYTTIGFMVHLADERFYSLVATAVLSVSMLFILYRMQWYRLVLFGILGAYGTHVIWLWPFLGDTAKFGPDGADFWSGMSMLILYWVTFNVGVFIFRPQNKKHETLSLWMMAANFFLFFAVYRYQLGSGHADWNIHITEGLALVYVYMAWLAWFLKRGNLYTLNLVIATLCTTMALYYHLDDTGWVTIAWLIQAEALYVAGLLGDEKRFRNIAIANFILVALWMLFNDYNIPDTVTVFGGIFYKRTIIAATVAIFFYINTIFRHVLDYKIENEEGHSYLFGYAASILWLIIMVRNWYPDSPLNIALASAMFGIALMEIGIRTWDHHLRIQALFYTYISVIAGLFPLLFTREDYLQENLIFRIIAEGFVIVFAYYVFARFQKRISTEEDTRQIEIATGLFSSITAVIAVMLLHREFTEWAPIWTIFVWMLLGIMLLELGLALRNVFFRIQGYLVTCLTLIWALYTYIFRPYWLVPGPFHFLANLLVVIGFFYLFMRLLSAAERDSTAFSAKETNEVWSGTGPLLSIFFSVAGTLILALTLQREVVELRPLFVAVAWLAVGIALLECGIAFKNRSLRNQAIAISVAAFLYAIFVNQVSGDTLGPFSDRLITLLLCVVALYWLFNRYSMGVSLDAEKPGWADYPGAPPLLSWLAAILLSLLVMREMWDAAPSWLGCAWTLVILGWIYAGIRKKSPSFIVQAIVLSFFIFFYSLLITITDMPTIFIGNNIDLQRHLAVTSVILVFYALFTLVLIKTPCFAGEKLKSYISFASGLFSWFAAALLVSLITELISGNSESLTTVLWILLAIAFYEIGTLVKNPHLESQGYALAAGTFVRTTWVNIPSNEGNFLGLPGELSAPIIVILGLYFLWFMLSRSEEDSSATITKAQMGTVMSYFGSITLFILLYNQVTPLPWVTVAWAGLALFLFLKGIIFRDRRIIYEFLIFTVPVYIGVVAYGFPEHGTALGRETVGIALGSIILARVVWQFGIFNFSDLWKESVHNPGFILGSFRHWLSLPPAILLAVYIMTDFTGDLTIYVTVGWACEGFLLMLLGFIFNDRVLRVSGLTLLGLSILKVFRDILFLDVERQYKVVTLIGIGILLIVTGWTYSRFRERINKTFMNDQSKGPENHEAPAECEVLEEDDKSR